MRRVAPPSLSLSLSLSGGNGGGEGEMKVRRHIRGGGDLFLSHFLRPHFSAASNNNLANDWREGEEKRNITHTHIYICTLHTHICIYICEVMYPAVVVVVKDHVHCPFPPPPPLPTNGKQQRTSSFFVLCSLFFVLCSLFLGVPLYFSPSVYIQVHVTFLFFPLQSTDASW